MISPVRTAPQCTWHSEGVVPASTHAWQTQHRNSCAMASSFASISARTLGSSILPNGLAPVLIRFLISLPVCRPLRNMPTSGPPWAPGILLAGTIDTLKSTGRRQASEAPCVGLGVDTRSPEQQNARIPAPMDHLVPPVCSCCVVLPSCSGTYLLDCLVLTDSHTASRVIRCCTNRGRSGEEAREC
jgi:hypothetical protein